MGLAQINSESTTEVLPGLSEPMDFYSFTREELAVFFEKQLGWPAYRATQMFNWVYKAAITDIDQMNNISRSARDLLKELFVFKTADQLSRQVSKDGTRKYLFSVAPETSVESVFIKQTNRNTLCVSSQVGCGMGCTFCRTATMGFQKNLTSGDIVRQVVGAISDARQYGDSFSNMVFMGMGEPLHNLNNVARAVQIIKDDQGIGLGPRRITISTVGLVPAIRKYARMDLGVNLAVSLNAATDEVRSQIMPINKRYPIAELLDALSEVPLSGRKQLTIEYVMLADVNDSPEDIKRLPKLLKDLRCKINLIPYNENAGLGFKTPRSDWIQHWYKELNRLGLQTTVRWSKGSDIDAACGQLKAVNS